MPTLQDRIKTILESKHADYFQQVYQGAFSAQLDQHLGRPAATSQTGGFWDTTLGAASQQAAADVLGVAARTLGMRGETGEPGSSYADELNRKAVEVERRQAQFDEQSMAPAWLRRGARGAARSFMPAAVLGRLGGPYASIAGATLIRANQAVTEGRDAGLKDVDLASYVIAQGVLEGGIASAFQRMGMGGFESVVGGKLAASQSLKEALKKLGVNTWNELKEEVLTEVSDNLIQWLSGVDPTAMSPDNLAQTVADTFVQVVLMVGAGSSPDVIQASLRKRGGGQAGQQPGDRQQAAQQPSPEAAEQTIEAEVVEPATAKPAAAEPAAAQPAAQEQAPQETAPQEPTKTAEELEREEQALYENFYGSPASAADWAVAHPDKARQLIEGKRYDVARLQELDPDLPPLADQQARRQWRDWVAESLENPETAAVYQEAFRGQQPDPDQPLILSERWQLLPEDAEPMLRGIAANPRIETRQTSVGTFVRLKPVRRMGQKADREPAAEQPVVEQPAAATETLPPLPPELAQATDAELQDLLVSMGDKRRLGKKPARDLLETRVRQALYGAKKPEALRLGQKARAEQEPAGPAAEQPAAQPAAEPAAAAQTEPPSLTREDILSVFPGSRLYANRQLGGWTIELPSGHAFDLRQSEQIAVNWDQLEQRIGRKIPAEQRAKLQAVGALKLVAGGREYSGAFLVEVSNRAENMTSTLRHEALHLARAMGLFTDREWQALVKQHADPKAPFDIQEEQVADSRKAWRGPRGVAQKIKAWLNSILSRLGLSNVDPEAVHVLMESPAFWARKPQPPEQAAAYSLEERSEGGQPEQQQPAGPVRETMTAEQRQATRPGPRPDLANWGQTPEVRQMLADVDQQRQEEGLPQRITREQVWKEAAERLAADPAAARRMLLDRGRSGGQLDAVETAMAQIMLNEDGLEALASGDRAQLQHAYRLHHAMRQTGTSQGQAFAMRQEVKFDLPPNQRRLVEILDSIYGPGTKEKKIDRLRKKADKLEAAGELEQAKQLREEADKLEAAAAAEIESLAEKLKVAGFDLSKIWDYVKDPTGSKPAQIIRIADTVRSNYWDAVFEYYRNSLMSAATTFISNLSSMPFGVYHLTAERFVEATANLALRRDEGASFGEFAEMLPGIMPGLAMGWQNALTSWQDERASPFEEMMAIQHQSKWDGSQVHIEGLKGQVIRTPQRLVKAADQMLKTAFANIEVGARAYRNGKARGLKGEKLSRFIAQQVNDLRSQSWRQAVGTAQTIAFEQEGAPLTRDIKELALRARRKLPGSRYQLPFVTFAINSMETAMARLPVLGTIPLARRMVENYQAGRNVFDGTPARVAQQFIAWAAMMAIMASNDEEDPWITGAEMEWSEATREAYKAMRIPPQAIKLGGQWHSYARAEPFSTIIGTIVDWSNAFRSGNVKRMVRVPVTSLVGQVGEKTYLKGIGEIVDAFRGKAIEEGIADWLSRFAVSWIPNLFRSAGRGLREDHVERRVWGGTSQEWFMRLARRTLQKTELTMGVIPDTPAYDILGREIPTSRSPLPGTDALWRIVMPVATTNVERPHLLYRFLMKWNRDNPDQSYLPLTPARSYEWRGKSYSMTDQQYADYARLAGLTTARLIELGGYDPEQPSVGQLERIRNDIEAARGAVKKELIPLWQSGRDAGDAIDPDEIAAQVAGRRLESLRQAAASQWVGQLRPGETRQQFIDRRNDHLQRVQTARELLQLVARQRSARQTAQAAQLPEGG